MRFIVLIVTVIGIATPASSIDKKGEEIAIVRAIGRIDSLLAQGQPDQALEEFEGMREAVLGYVQGRISAQAHNSLARFPLFLPGGPTLGDYPKAASSLQKSLAAAPTQKTLFEILALIARDNSELYDMLATALDEAGHSDMAHDSRALAKDRRRFVEMIEAALEPLSKDEDRTSLHSAVDGGFVRLAETWIEMGEDVNARDSRGLTALHYAANQSYVVGNREAYLELVGVLLKAGANINAKDNKGSTPLHYAAVNDANRMVEVLLKAGADINEKNNSGMTPIVAAIRAHSFTSVELLRRYRVLSP